MAAVHDPEREFPRLRLLRLGGFVVSFGVLLASFFLFSDRQLALLVGAGSLAGMALFFVHRLRSVDKSGSEQKQLAAVRIAYGDDVLPTWLVDSDGAVGWSNTAALRIGVKVGTTLEQVDGLKAIIPNLGNVLKRVSHECSAFSTASETLFGAEDGRTLHARQIGDCQLWRMQSVDGLHKQIGEQTAMLTTGRNGTILFMNYAAKALIGERLTSLDRLFTSATPKKQGPQSIMTTRGTVLVDVETQILQGDRQHVFLAPITKRSASSAGFALADLPVPLMRLSKKGRIEDANDTAHALLGVSKCVGEEISEIFVSLGNQLEDWLERCSEPSADCEAEFLRVKNAKKETFVQVTLRQIGTRDEPELIAVLTDATKLKSLEAQFVQSQKMQAIGQLAGGVAHDFNNLLTAISGHCDLMLLRHDPGDLDYSDLMQIHQNANRAASLVSQLLAFSRKQTLQPEILDLRDTLSDLTHLLNRLVGETVKLSLSHDPVLKTVRADKRQLEQVIMNLVVNARDAMPQGGEITVETESMSLLSPLKRERVTVPAGDYVVVRVRDQGIGIEPAALEKIFEPFYTTKRTGEGTGLGLSTAYGIVKQTGGYIFADSESGLGTCFSLLFPVCEEAAESPSALAAEKPTVATEHCDGIVLLVEDEAPVRAFASRALQMRGFTVIEADCAEQALALLENEQMKVDVFVTDVVMPGMDGPSWVRKALEKRPDVQVVFVSGYAEGAFQGKRPEVPNSVFLPKPFSLADLTSTVQERLQ